MCQAENPLHMVASPGTVSTRRRDPLRRPCPAQVRAVLRWALGGEASVPARCTLCPSTPSPPQCAPSAARRAPAVHGAKYLRGVGWGVRRARAYAPLPVL